MNSHEAPSEADAQDIEPEGSEMLDELLHGLIRERFKAAGMEVGPYDPRELALHRALMSPVPPPEPDTYPEPAPTIKTIECGTRDSTTDKRAKVLVASTGGGFITRLLSQTAAIQARLSAVGLALVARIHGLAVSFNEALIAAVQRLAVFPTACIVLVVASQYSEQSIPPDLRSTIRLLASIGRYSSSHMVPAFRTSDGVSQPLSILESAPLTLTRQEPAATSVARADVSGADTRKMIHPRPGGVQRAPPIKPSPAPERQDAGTCSSSPCSTSELPSPDSPGWLLDRVTSVVDVQER